MAVTTLVGVALVVVVLPLRLSGARLRAGRASAWIFRNWARASARTLAARVEVRGPIPTAPFFLVSNHLGYVDVLVLASVLDCVFVSKADVAHWPVLGPLVGLVGTVFIDREAKRDIPRVLARIEENLTHGRGIVVFPEGTSSKGATVLPFRPPLLEVAARSRMPVSCVTLTYRTEPGNPPAHLAVCWWGGMGFVAHLLALFRLSGFVATVTFGEDRIVESDRKALASRTREAVLARFEPVTDPNRFKDRAAPDDARSVRAIEPAELDPSGCSRSVE
jgi:1-acyl-sn-glycerol-3-phosphate acyltransferase